MDPKKALELDLYVFAQKKINGNLVVGVAGEEEKISLFKRLCEQGQSKADLDGIFEKKLDKCN